LLLAWASYVWIENPFRRGTLFRNAYPPLVILGGVSCVLLSWGAGRLLNRESGRLSLSVTQKHSRDWYPTAELPATGNHARKCGAATSWIESVGNVNVTVFDHGECNASGDVRNLFVTGNSHVDAYETLFSMLTSREPFNVRAFNFNGCALLYLARPTSSDSEFCKSFYKNVFADIESRLRPGDIVFLPSLRLPRLGDQWAAFSEPDALDELFGQQALIARQAAVEEADNVLDRLVRDGAVIIFEAPKPIFRAPAFRCADWFNVKNPICKPGLTISRDYLLHYRTPVLDAMISLSRRHEHVYVWDPFETLCPTATCAALVNGLPLFLDGDHLSANGNRVLYPNFLGFLRSLRLPRSS
jgi:hypothetical protein